MRTSEKGVNMLVAFEGMELKAYKCPAGVWTIGVGHTGKIDNEEICSGMSITREKALHILGLDLKKVENYINRQPFANGLTQGQFDALSSFIFNIGTTAFHSSTMRKLLSEGATTARVAKEFCRWVYGKVNGKKERLPGLVGRRNREKKLFLYGWP